MKINMNFAKDLFIKLIPLGAMILLIAFAFAIDKSNPKDNTDSPNKRSGMNLHTDNKTGCQYLSTFFGRPIPRTDKNNKQLCGERDE